MYNFRHQTAFITGGSRGIGAAVALKFAAYGADVAFSYRSNREAAESVLDKMAPYGGRYRAYACDMADASAIKSTMDVFLAEFGKADILVNNAGIIRDALLGAMSDEDWNSVINVNLTGAFLHTRAVLPGMMAQRSGAIVNIGSVSGESGNAGQTNYTAAKAGLIGLTKSLAREVGGRNIRCNLVAPGLIGVGMAESVQSRWESYAKNNIALKRPGTPEEVADAVVFLASDFARYITGQVLYVCGGMSGL